MVLKSFRMKIPCIVVVVAIALLSMQGCVSARTAHQRTLQSCRTQDDVSRYFGLPAEEVHDQTTEWIYNLASRRDSLAGKVFVKVADSVHANKESKYYKYLEFTFDSYGNVIGYTSNVDDPVRAYTNKGNNITVLRVIGGTLIFILIIYVASRTGADITF
jgi:hypothetical protein